MNKFFKYLCAGLLAVAITGCGISATVPGQTGGEMKTFNYSTSDFSISVPDGWVVTDKFTSNYPGSMKVAFVNNIKGGDFTANISVIKEDNPNLMTSYDLAQEKIAAHRESLLNYELVSQEEIMVEAPGGESRTLLNKFKGKNVTSGPTLNFIQVTVAKGSNSFTATAAYSDGEDTFTITKLENALKSFTLK